MAVRAATTISVLISLAFAQGPKTGTGPPRTLVGEISYFGLSALPSNSTVHVYFSDITSHPPRIVAEKRFLIGDEQIPIKFSLTNLSVETGHEYSVCGDITILRRRAFDCDKPVPIHLERWPQLIKLVLRRAP